MNKNSSKIILIIASVIILSFLFTFINRYYKNVNYFQPITLKINGLNQNDINNVKIQTVSPHNKTFNLNYVSNNNAWISNYGYSKYLRIIINEGVLIKLNTITIEIGNNKYLFTKNEFITKWNLININNNKSIITYQCPQNVKGSDSIILKIFSIFLFGGIIRYILISLIIIICIFIFYKIIIKYSNIFYKSLNVIFLITKKALNESKKTLNKILIIFIGLIVILILIEVCLRIVGYIHIKNRYDYSILNRHKGDYTILCIGDSFTAGLGAPIGRSYPEQLEKILNAKTNKKFSVINRGVSNENTSNMLDRLSHEINSFKPSVVVLLAGGANNWNLWGFNNSSMNKFLYNLKTYKLIKLLYRDIIYKNNDLEKHVYSNNLKDGLLKLSLNNFIESVNKDSLNSDNYYNLGNFYYYEMKDTSEAIKWFKKGIKINPDDRKIYDVIIQLLNNSNKQNILYNWVITELNNNPDNVNLWFCFSNIDKSLINKSDILDFFNKYVQRIKNKDISYKTSTYPIITYAYVLSKNDEIPVKFAKEELKTDKNNIILNIIMGFLSKEKFINDDSEKYFKIATAIYDDSISKNKPKYINFYKLIYNNFSHLKYPLKLKITNDIEIYNILKQQNNQSKYSNSNLVSGWIKSDLIKIIEICNSLGIKVVIQNYPLHYKNPPERGVNDIIYEIVQENPSLLFIDNRLTFANLKEPNDNYFEQHGSHPNETGYEIMANSIADKIIKNNLFDIK